jgi:hypothetical protein
MGRPHLFIYMILALLAEEERKHNQSHEEKSRERADTSEITFNVSVIGVEFSARR